MKWKQLFCAVAVGISVSSACFAEETTDGDGGTYGPFLDSNNSISSSLTSGFGSGSCAVYLCTSEGKVVKLNGYPIADDGTYSINESFGVVTSVTNNNTNNEISAFNFSDTGASSLFSSSPGITLEDAQNVGLVYKTAQMAETDGSLYTSSYLNYSPYLSGSSQYNFNLSGSSQYNFNLSGSSQYNFNFTGLNDSEDSDTEAEEPAQDAPNSSTTMIGEEVAQSTQNVPIPKVKPVKTPDEDDAEEEDTQETDVQGLPSRGMELQTVLPDFTMNDSETLSPMVRNECRLGEAPEDVCNGTVSPTGGEQNSDAETTSTPDADESDSFENELYSDAAIDEQQPESMENLSDVAQEDSGEIAADGINMNLPETRTMTEVTPPEGVEQQQTVETSSFADMLHQGDNEGTSADSNGSYYSRWDENTEELYSDDAPSDNDLDFSAFDNDIQQELENDSTQSQGEMAQNNGVNSSESEVPLVPDAGSSAAVANPSEHEVQVNNSEPVDGDFDNVELVSFDEETDETIVELITLHGETLKNVERLAEDSNSVLVIAEDSGESVELMGGSFSEGEAPSHSGVYTRKDAEKDGYTSESIETCEAELSGDLKSCLEENVINFGEELIR